MASLDLIHLGTSVAKFIDFGRRLFSDTWHIYRAESAETAIQSNLSAISLDLAQLCGIIKKALEVNDDGEREAHDLLIASCNECVALEGEFQGLLEKIGPAFRGQYTPVGVGDNAVFPLDTKQPSFGQAFRAALQSRWKSDDIDQLRSRLSVARDRIQTTLTTGIWIDSIKNKQHDKAISEKLDTMIATLLDSLNTSALSGPISEKDAHATSVLHHRGIFNELKKASPNGGHFADLARKRIWDKQWTPDPSVLASFPRRTSVLKESLIDFIMDALQFSSMDSREHAISEPFERTYDWIFDLDPRLSNEGVQMWPSFPNWLENKNAATYWITGKPGSGKSTMMKFIMNSPALGRHLQQWSAGGLVHKIRYYAWKPGQKLDKSKEGLMRTLLYQMVTADPGLTPYLFPRRWTLFHMIRTVEKDNFPPLTTEELEESVYRLADHTGGSPSRVILMIDGLDEFDEAPAEICAMLQRIGSHESIKVCAASRPWPQFTDTFANSPQMQMHDVTRPAMSTFVDGHFRGELAFQHLNQVYSNGGDRLLSELVEKSQGVFLWLSLVTRMLLGAMVDGESLVELQRVLSSLPSEIKTLYDAMFAAIPEHLLPSTSAILRLCRTPPTPIHWLTLWLADELREAPITIELAQNSFDRDAVKAALKRRLSARTRGILEIVDHNGTVVYLHRSVAEWMELHRVWQQVNSWSPSTFDPHYCLAGAETVLLGWENPELSSMWARAERALSHASQIDQNRTSDEAITAVLDRLDVNVRSKVTEIELAKFDSNSPLVVYRIPELAVHFAVLPYIRHRLEEGPHHFSAEPPSGMPWLEQAVMAPAITGYSLMSHWAFSETNMEQRLQVIKMLLQYGLRSKGLAAQVKANRTRGLTFANEALKVLEGRWNPVARDPIARDPVSQKRRLRDYFKFGPGGRRGH